MSRIAIKIIWEDGEEEFLLNGVRPGGAIATFTSFDRAQGQAEFINEGIEGGKAHAVKAPRKDKSASPPTSGSSTTPADAGRGARDRW